MRPPRSRRRRQGRGRSGPAQGRGGHVSRRTGTSPGRRCARDRDVGQPVPAAVAPEPVGLPHERGRSGDGGERRVVQRGVQPGRAQERRQPGLGHVPDPMWPRPSTTSKAIGTRSTATTSPTRAARSAIGPPSRPLNTSSSERCCSCVHRSSTSTAALQFPASTFPGMCTDRHRHRSETSMPADRPAVDVPAQDRVARPVPVRVLADPARAQDLAGAHLQQPALHRVGRRLCGSGHDRPLASRHVCDTPLTRGRGIGRTM